MKSVGIVGCGSIGRSLLKAVDDGVLSVDIAGVTSRTEKAAREFLSTLRHPVSYLNLAELISRSDLVVEAAGGAIVPGLARDTFEAGKDLMVISIGALLDHPEVFPDPGRPGVVFFCRPGRLPVSMASNLPASARSPV